MQNKVNDYHYYNFKALKTIHLDQDFMKGGIPVMGN
jgi:hypothetical protein